MPNRLIASPIELTNKSWRVSISGGSIIRWIPSKMMKMEMRMRKQPVSELALQQASNSPFAKPLSVSTRA